MHLSGVKTDCLSVKARVGGGICAGQWK